VRWQGSVGVISVEGRSIEKQKSQAEMTTIELIQYWGYPAEEHNVVTKDGYILTMHRIPYGKSGPTANRPAVFMQHGLEDSSAGWVLNLPEKSAGFIFADEGFDIWLGNMRGNTYSKNHTTLSVKSHDFWAFSFDEMVQYDLDAQIDYVLKTTSQTSLYYIGHSQGTLTMFSKLARDPTFLKKLKKVFCLAPVGSVQYIKGLIEAVSGKYLDVLSWYYWYYGDCEFVPSDWIISELAEYICAGYWGTYCDYFVMLIMGTDSNQLSKERTAIYLSHIPAGTSTKNFVHWSQMVRSGLMAEYDYKKDGNIQHYGTVGAPIYDIRDIDATTKIYLYWSPSDWLADQKDVTGFLLKHLPATAVVENNMLLDFNHVDFLWGDRAADEVYTPILKSIRDDL